MKKRGSPYRYIVIMFLFIVIASVASAFGFLGLPGLSYSQVREVVQTADQNPSNEQDQHEWVTVYNYSLTYDTSSAILSNYAEPFIDAGREIIAIRLQVSAPDETRGYCTFGHRPFNINVGMGQNTRWEIQSDSSRNYYEPGQSTYNHVFELENMALGIYQADSPESHYQVLESPSNGVNQVFHYAYSNTFNDQSSTHNCIIDVAYADSSGASPNPTTSSYRIVSPSAGAQLSPNGHLIAWSGTGQADQFQLYVGSSPNTNSYFDSGNLNGDIRSITVTGLPNTGGTVYATLKYLVAGTWNSHVMSYLAPNTGSSGGEGTVTAPTGDCPGEYCWRLGSELSFDVLDCRQDPSPFTLHPRTDFVTDQNTKVACFNPTEARLDESCVEWVCENADFAGGEPSGCFDADGIKCNAPFCQTMSQEQFDSCLEANCWNAAQITARNAGCPYGCEGKPPLNVKVWKAEDQRNYRGCLSLSAQNAAAVDWRDYPDGCDTPVFNDMCKPWDPSTPVGARGWDPSWGLTYQEYYHTSNSYWDNLCSNDFDVSDPDQAWTFELCCNEGYDMGC